MNEAQRQVYLRHCGVSSWYSRAALPGAAVSIDFDFSDVPAEFEAATVSHSVPGLAPVPPVVTRATISGATSGQAKPVRERVMPAAEKSALDKVIAEAAAPVSVAAPVTAATQPLQARSKGKAVEPVSSTPVADVHASVSAQLRIALTDTLVIVAQLGEDLPAAVQEKLLLQIAVALGRPFSPDALEELAWPVFTNREVPGNDDQGLAATLQRVLEPMASRAWLILGPDACGLLAEPDAKPAAALRVAFKYDLGMLASSGALKQQLWGLLRSSLLPSMLPSAGAEA